MSAGNNALPRLRTLCTNSKNPRYNGSRSCEIPRWGRSQLRPCECQFDAVRAAGFALNGLPFCAFEMSAIAFCSDFWRSCSR